MQAVRGQQPNLHDSRRRVVPQTKCTENRDKTFSAVRSSYQCHNVSEEIHLNNKGCYSLKVIHRSPSMVQIIISSSISISIYSYFFLFFFIFFYKGK